MNQINGRKIAQGAAKWIGPKEGYAIMTRAYAPGDITLPAGQKNPGYVVNKAFLKENNIKMKDLTDCIEQIEAYGEVQEVKDQFGLETYGGTMNAGLVVTSRKNKKVSCIVALNSGVNEAAHDLYLEWYFDTDHVTDPGYSLGYMDEFNRLVGTPGRGIIEGKERDEEEAVKMRGLQERLDGAADEIRAVLMEMRRLKFYRPISLLKGVRALEEQASEINGYMKSYVEELS